LQNNKETSVKNYIPSTYKPGIDPELDLQILIEKCHKALPNMNEELIRKAFRFCVNAHKGQLRANGEPYYTHPLAVAEIALHEIPLDDFSIAAALLHDVVEDTRFSLKDIQAEFGSVVANIVDGTTKITGIFQSREISKAESYRKLLLSLINDVRVILVKFADRLHNMRTLDNLPEHKQQQISRETIDIYAPFSHRFGLGRIKWELEDLSFKYLNRIAYDDVKKALNATRQEREEYIEQFIQPLREQLTLGNLKCDISGRPKHIFSIFTKMIAQGKTIDQLHDLSAIRIILDSTHNSDCFLAYGIISEIYTPIPERFKDYISVPKKNGYKSLHTTVIGPKGKRVEIQIRTRAMHEVAEQGVAAHFRYKSDSIDPENRMWEDKELEEWASWVRDVFDNAGEEAPQQLYESFKLNLYQNEIYVFTPKGELRILPKDSTTVDFAFDIHTQIGYHCIGAKVNGKIVPLSHKLVTGDQVEIITSKNQIPNRDWEAFVITHKAKSQIRKFLNEEKRSKVRNGKEIWEKYCRKNSVHFGDDEFEKMLMILKYENKTEFFFAISLGTLPPSLAVEKLREKSKPETIESLQINKSLVLDKVREGSSDIQIADGISDSKDLMYSYGRCCNPVPGDDIVGIVTIGHGIKVHRENCKNIVDLLGKKSSRIVNLNWSTLQDGTYVAAIRITGDDRASMLSDITSAIVGVKNTNIRSVNIDTFDSVFEGVVTVYVENVEHLEVIFKRLGKITGVKSVERYAG